MQRDMELGTVSPKSGEGCSLVPWSPRKEVDLITLLSAWGDPQFLEEELVGPFFWGRKITMAKLALSQREFLPLCQESLSLTLSRLWLIQGRNYGGGWAKV